MIIWYGSEKILYLATNESTELEKFGGFLFTNTVVIQLENKRAELN